MKRRFKRLASMLLTVTLLAANVPVYAVGDTGSEDIPVVEEADTQDEEFHDISDCCVIVDNVITSYSGAYEKISIPEGVTGIAAYVFRNKKELREVKWPSSLKTIGQNAFT